MTGSHSDQFDQPDKIDPEDFNRVVTKLSKINAALMQRVERSMDQQANAFSLFQTAISQEAQIRLRTEQLDNALTKLAQANDELRDARDTAERANLFKTRFFTSVGHDLLQPIHAARLTLSELTDQQHGDANQRLAGKISLALTNIEELLTSILDISKLEAGAFVPNMQTVALNQVFERLVTSLEPMTRQKSLELRWRPTNLAVRSDPLMLRRIIQNLLANAANYTQSGGLLLAARRRGENVAIEVWDTGSGVPDAESGRIFDEFQRGTTTTGGGFGLGLTIVKRMADALAHTLELRSRVGRGSKFSISAPSAAHRSDAATRGDATRVVSPLPSTTSSALSCPVLVIDNDLSVLDAMQTTLARWGADVRLARDLDDISEILTSTSFVPAIILADYHLDHGVVGLEAVARVREATSATLPAILITADHSATTAAAAQAAQCEILHKPMRPAELRALMQHLLK